MSTDDGRAWILGVGAALVGAVGVATLARRRARDPFIETVADVQIAIRPSPIEGRGLFAQESLRKDQRIGPGLLRVAANNKEEDLRQTTITRFVNHALPANVHFIPSMTPGITYDLVTTRAVRKGDELVADYDAYADFVEQTAAVAAASGSSIGRGSPVRTGKRLGNLPKVDTNWTTGSWVRKGVGEAGKRGALSYTNLYLLVADSAIKRRQYHNIYSIVDDLVVRDSRDGVVRLKRKSGRELGRDVRHGAYQDEGKKEIDILWVTAVVDEPVVVFHGVYADPSLTGHTDTDLGNADWPKVIRAAGLGFLIDTNEGDQNFYSVRHHALSQSSASPQSPQSSDQTAVARPYPSGSPVRVGPRLLTAQYGRRWATAHKAILAAVHWLVPPAHVNETERGLKRQWIPMQEAIHVVSAGDNEYDDEAWTYEDWLRDATTGIDMFREPGRRVRVRETKHDPQGGRPTIAELSATQPEHAAEWITDRIATREKWSPWQFALGQRVADSVGRGIIAARRIDPDGSPAYQVSWSSKDRPRMSWHDTSALTIVPERARRSKPRGSSVRVGPRLIPSAITEATEKADKHWDDRRVVEISHLGPSDRKKYNVKVGGRVVVAAHIGHAGNPWPIGRVGRITKRLSSSVIVRFSEDPDRKWQVTAIYVPDPTLPRGSSVRVGLRLRPAGAFDPLPRRRPTKSPGPGTQSDPHNPSYYEPHAPEVVIHRLEQVLGFLRAVRQPTEDPAGLREAASRAIRGFSDLKSRSEIEPAIGIVGQYRVAEAIAELRDAQGASDPTFRIDDAIRWLASALDPSCKPPGGSIGSAVRVGPRLRAIGDDPRQASGVRAILERTSLALDRLRAKDMGSIEHAIALLTYSEPVVSSPEHGRFEANPSWVHDWQVAFDPHQRALVGKVRISLVDDGMYGLGEAIDDLRLALEEESR